MHPTTHEKPGVKTAVTAIAQSYLRKGTQFPDCLFHSTQQLCNVVLLCPDLILQSYSHPCYGHFETLESLDRAIFFHWLHLYDLIFY